MRNSRLDDRQHLQGAEETLEVVAAASDADSPRAPQAPDVPAMAADLPAAQDSVQAGASSAPFAAESLNQRGRYAEPAARLASTGPGTAELPVYSRLARSLADQGRLAEALDWCNRWIAADSLNPAAHYLHAVVLLERRESELARACLRRALYLDPDFALAHFLLGNLARSHGKFREARKHYANALDLLDGRRPNETLPEPEGLTAGRLAEIIRSAMTVEAAP